MPFVFTYRPPCPIKPRCVERGPVLCRLSRPAVPNAGCYRTPTRRSLPYPVGPRPPCLSTPFVSKPGPVSSCLPFRVRPCSVLRRVSAPIPTSPAQPCLVAPNLACTHLTRIHPSHPCPPRQCSSCYSSPGLSTSRPPRPAAPNPTPLCRSPSNHSRHATFLQLRPVRTPPRPAEPSPPGRSPPYLPSPCHFLQARRVFPLQVIACRVPTRRNAPRLARLALSLHAIACRSCPNLACPAASRRVSSAPTRTVPAFTRLFVCCPSCDALLSFAVSRHTSPAESCFALPERLRALFSCRSSARTVTGSPGLATPRLVHVWFRHARLDTPSRSYSCGAESHRATPVQSRLVVTPQAASFIDQPIQARRACPRRVHRSPVSPSLPCRFTP